MTTHEPQPQSDGIRQPMIMPAMDHLHEIFETCDFLSDEECIACALAADRGFGE